MNVDMKVKFWHNGYEIENQLIFLPLIPFDKPRGALVVVLDSHFLCIENQQMDPMTKVMFPKIC